MSCHLFVRYIFKLITSIDMTIIKIYSVAKDVALTRLMPDTIRCIPVLSNIMHADNLAHKVAKAYAWMELTV